MSIFHVPPVDQSPSTSVSAVQSPSPTDIAFTTAAHHAAHTVSARVVSLIGQGAFSRVFLARSGMQRTQHALKVIDMAACTMDLREAMTRELQLVGQLAHHHIVHMWHMQRIEYYVCIHMEYLAGGSLIEEMMKSENQCGMETKRAKTLFRQMVEGINYLHAMRSLVHRDVKLDNCLLDAQGNCKWIDFTFARYDQHPYAAVFTTTCGSVGYAAPELYESAQPYIGAAVDYWALGVCLYTILTGVFPFGSCEDNSAVNVARVRRRALTRDYQVNHLVNDATRQSQLDAPAMQLITHLLCVPMEKRAAYIDVVHSPCLRSTVWTVFVLRGGAASNTNEKRA